MTVKQGVRIADSPRLPLANAALFQILVPVIPAAALRSSVGKLRRRCKAVLRSTAALAGIVAAVVPEAVDLYGVHRTARGAAEEATGTNVATVARHL